MEIKNIRMTSNNDDFIFEIPEFEHFWKLKLDYVSGWQFYCWDSWRKCIIENVFTIFCFFSLIFRRLFLRSRIVKITSRTNTIKLELNWCTRLNWIRDLFLRNQWFSENMLKPSALQVFRWLQIYTSLYTVFKVAA